MTGILDKQNFQYQTIYVNGKEYKIIYDPKRYWFFWTEIKK